MMNLWSWENGYDYYLTIDRRDNYQGYSPANCRWITNREQQFNKRKHQDAGIGAVGSKTP